MQPNLNARNLAFEYNPRMAKELTAERLRELLNYDAETGVFRRRVDLNRRGKRWAGTIAGTVSRSNGYTLISVDGRVQFAHKLAWLYMTGEWPSGQIDHKNLVRSDNRFCNLREATPAQNKQNTLGSRGASGLKGVYFHFDHHRTKAYRAKITANGRTISLGYFKTPEEAHAAYCKASAELHGEFGRTK